MNISNIFDHAQLYMNDYFAPNSFSAKGDNFLFPSYFERTKDELYHPWFYSSRGYFLGFSSSGFGIFWYTRLSPMCEGCGANSRL